MQDLMKLVCGVAQAGLGTKARAQNFLSLAALILPWLPGEATGLRPRSHEGSRTSAHAGPTGPGILLPVRR